MWVTVSGEYRHKVNASGTAVKRYRPSAQPISVPEAHGKAMIAAGKAVEVERPNQPSRAAAPAQTKE